MVRKTLRQKHDAEFERQMAVARRVMEEDWVVLRALALGDQHPELDVEARIQIGRKQAPERGKEGRS